MTEALQRQLANNEPKCGNCEHWDRMPLRDWAGYCERMLSESDIPPVITTDLQVCSKHEERESHGTETKAETGQA